MVGTDLESVKGQLCDLKVSFLTKVQLFLVKVMAVSDRENHCFLDIPKVTSVVMTAVHLRTETKSVHICFIRNLSENFTRRKLK